MRILFRIGLTDALAIGVVIVTTAIVLLLICRN